MKNEDGLVAGQEVDFKTLMLIKRKEKAEENAKPKAKQRERKAKLGTSD